MPSGALKLQRHGYQSPFLLAQAEAMSLQEPQRTLVLAENISLDAGCSLFLCHVDQRLQHYGTQVFPPEAWEDLQCERDIFAHLLSADPSRAHDHLLPILDHLCNQNDGPVKVHEASADQVRPAQAACHLCLLFRHGCWVAAGGPGRLAIKATHHPFVLGKDRPDFGLRGVREVHRLRILVWVGTDGWLGPILRRRFRAVKDHPRIQGQNGVL
mmetsp:Transcript_43479/g.81100  ORF Transcript_43479/g.81100 Transcript_43479/m.81100 type:complete len:213 (+) Transcript_43479:353-991(+)